MTNNNQNQAGKVIEILRKHLQEVSSHNESPRTFQSSRPTKSVFIELTGLGDNDHSLLINALYPEANNTGGNNNQ